MKGLRLSVIIPTYQRPEWLARAVASLVSQDPVPGEVILVTRQDDAPTHEAITRLQGSCFPFPIRKGVVVEPGFMPPVQEGFRLACGDVSAVMDDDAEALPGWTRGLLRHYENPAVGGVGGRYINMNADREAEVPKTRRVGFVSPLGRFVGNMYMQPTFAGPVSVQFLMGGCMSFRREVAAALQFDPALNSNAAFGYEVDLGLQARAAGWLLVFDPAVAVRHYSAPRAVAGMRKVDDAESAFWYAHNAARVALRRLAGFKRIVSVTWALTVGERRAPGLLPWLLGPFARRVGYQTVVARAAFAGRLKALRDAGGG